MKGKFANYNLTLGGVKMANDSVVYDTVCGVCECLDNGKPSSECDPNCPTLERAYDQDGQTLLEKFRAFQRIQTNSV